jgi:hypothetical protein
VLLAAADKIADRTAQLMAARTTKSSEPLESSQTRRGTACPGV